uniref:GDSL esterase/lipase n=1 Tax=Leersia perrieri TaxID=77586 RepID=A0A0D9XJB2_9ORYZ
MGWDSLHGGGEQVGGSCHAKESTTDGAQPILAHGDVSVKFTRASGTRRGRIRRGYYSYSMNCLMTDRSTRLLDIGSNGPNGNWKMIRKQTDRWLVLIGILIAVVAADGRRQPPRTPYSRVFSFGDSLTDTGNAAILPITAGGPFTQPPYGMTFFHRPNGRASDGRLVIDFIVKGLGLPEPTPYLAGKTAADFQLGVNFAVGGSTALDPAFLKARGVTSFVPVSLSNETRWFDNALQLLGASADEQHMIAASSIFYFGEIGFNDYSFALSAGNGTVDVAVSLVPDVIAVIRSAVTKVIAAGARTVVVAGMIPIGCEPELLALFPGGATANDYYDPVSGCIKQFNNLAELHNRQLKRMILDLRRAHPGAAAIVRYADIYGPVTAAVASPAKYGFGGSPLAACCGGGGAPYNFNANFTGFCGTPGSTVCADGPCKSVSWDGIHYTEATNRLVARSILTRLPHTRSQALYK